MNSELEKTAKENLNLTFFHNSSDSSREILSQLKNRGYKVDEVSIGYDDLVVLHGNISFRGYGNICSHFLGS